MRKADQEVSPLVDEAMHLYNPESLGSKSARERERKREGDENCKFERKVLAGRNELL